MKRLLLAAAAVAAMACSGAATARVDIGISIGIPGVIIAEPDYYYPPVRYIERPRVVIVPDRIYRPVPVYRSRHYRQESRIHWGHKKHKSWKNHHHKRSHHKRGRGHRHHDD